MAQLLRYWIQQTSGSSASFTESWELSTLSTANLSLSDLVSPITNTKVTCLRSIPKEIFVGREFRLLPWRKGIWRYQYLNSQQRYSSHASWRHHEYSLVFRCHNISELLITFLNLILLGTYVFVFSMYMSDVFSTCDFYLFFMPILCLWQERFSLSRPISFLPGVQMKRPRPRTEVRCCVGLSMYEVPCI